MKKILFLLFLAAAVANAQVDALLIKPRATPPTNPLWVEGSFYQDLSLNLWQKVGGTWVLYAPGAGDLLSTNNLSDVANAATSLGNLNGFAKNGSVTATGDFNMGDNGFNNVEFNIWTNTSNSNQLSSVFDGTKAFWQLAPNGVSPEILRYNFTSKKWQINGVNVALTSDLSTYALDANVVHLTGAETITGLKTFEGVITANDNGDTTGGIMQMELPTLGNYSSRAALTGYGGFYFNDGGEFMLQKAGSGTNLGFDFSAITGVSKYLVFSDSDITWGGTSLLGGGGSGDVTAASSFGTDNRLIRSDGTGKGVQGSGITVDDSGNMNIGAAFITDGANAGGFNLFYGTITDQFTAGLIQLGESGVGDKSIFFYTDDVNSYNNQLYVDESDSNKLKYFNDETNVTVELTGPDGTGTDDQTAAEVAFTPDGSLSSTDVQAAIVELRDEAVTANSGIVAEGSADITTLTTSAVSGGFSTATTTITHGLGYAPDPKRIVCTLFRPNEQSSSNVVMSIGNITSTTFDVLTGAASGHELQLDWIIFGTGTIVGQTANEVSYDNGTSGLTATNVQAAIDENVVTLSAKLNSSTAGEPTGSAVIGNKVRISKADYDAAVVAGTTVATTEYTITMAGPADEDTGTVFDLGSYMQYNFSAASSATTFTLTNILPGGYAEGLINGTSEPSVTGADQRPNTFNWITATDLILHVKAYGSEVKYWYTEF